ncbi:MULTISPECIES: MogA/MoaB family molybdenum cofactor biosynthesis protein [unclassified Coleofasciculus]|uniref:MogA/MoaB family molybdenum cofactor biosynthesis protein n=1 Tax=unclassified Coleofasciculus TaxID=2692782 RepID=UPI001882F87B|nr:MULTISPECIES: MogA/MoaB family molybdenum cofactor biosynthesis protein [unclassified Coleofasciculus]MBE9129170.1 MogA/MoaB family molybdenum cofactor biosynthesis protein [Coleofasciculus sp. LEGE 07081]MBE9151096.1 MogA/MoaB family molybdenum cofactor biosynthesis protein [Coleofasciculus sp. LEGE 07092]
MTHQPHPDRAAIAINCAAITISDTRTPESDRSGQLVQELLRNAGYTVTVYQILKDEPTQIQDNLKALAARSDIDAVIFNGGTGIAPRDTTYDALEGLLEKTLPGFGEIFRYLSYQEIGSRAIASRAVAGVYQKTLIFSIPGSTGAVKLALQQLILPELVHLVTQLEN